MTLEEPINGDSTYEEKTKEYTQRLSSRVRSFHSDPLHSAAYLGNLAHFLQEPHRKSARTARRPNPQRYQPDGAAENRSRPFVYEYAIARETRPKLTVFDDVDKYKQTASDIGYHADCNEIVFLTGRPSAEWLCAVGVRETGTLLQLCPRVLRLRIPSLLFLGEHRYVDVKGLQKARVESERKLRQYFRSLQDGTSTDAGQSIVRRMNIHNGEGLVVEQELSVSLIKRGKYWTVLVWSDAGQDKDFNFLCAPHSDQYKEILDRLEFYPIFFEKNLSTKSDIFDPPNAGQVSGLRQPLSSLPGHYGDTIDWAKAAWNPLIAIQELFTFHGTSEVQYLNMLERFISDQISQAESSQSGTDIASILHFDYAKSILVRHGAHIEYLEASFDSGLTGWKSPVHESLLIDDDELKSTIQLDFAYLSSRIQNLISLCEAGRSTIMGNSAIEETRRSSEQSVLVTGLTKATNRLTFIFLPISFVTSAFGMNLKQLGQGNSSIWLWVAIALPLLLFCIILVERGSYMRASLVKCLKRRSKVT